MRAPGVLLAVLALATATGTGAADQPDLAQTMGMRYLRYERCMEQTFGESFYQRLGVATAINRWGVAEPTTSSLALQPQTVLTVDARCRKENQLTKEPRPSR